MDILLGSADMTLTGGFHGITILNFILGVEAIFVFPALSDASPFQDGETGWRGSSPRPFIPDLRGLHNVDSLGIRQGTPPSMEFLLTVKRKILANHD
ncbi:hypothetical protein H6P81_000933 [Aristolochia fimbriata]|uniref:Uncharacterized protein n=1 Tax=Aristolochia fimbriata TaxID=158543 RepID=A0AAV7F5H1_ARIFI|nr:hypothetical protein H6P81_000933 [Aristolochia fimbriata]